MAIVERSITVAGEVTSHDQLRVAARPDGSTVFQMMGEHGWEDCYEVALNGEAVEALIEFLGGSAR